MSARIAYLRVSLIEVAIVLVILGLIATIAIPRFGHANEQAAVEDLAASRLRLLRIAIERYRQDHHHLPATVPCGTLAAHTSECFTAQLTSPTRIDGGPWNSEADGLKLGPYLRDGIPPSPFCEGDSARRIRVLATNQPAASNPDGELACGWNYDALQGWISINRSAPDERDRP